MKMQADSVGVQVGSPNKGCSCLLESFAGMTEDLEDDPCPPLACFSIAGDRAGVGGRRLASVGE
jgi:hypothetical protein